jgi:hypothetical protein
VIRVKVNGQSVPQFDEFDLSEPTDYCKDWTFHGAMISTCSPVLDDLDDNHDFEARLRRAKVLRKNNRTDTESCEFWAYFSSQKAGMAFVERLNEYLRQRVCKMAAARAF